jgi:peroxiredoxin Q/BCP
MAALKAGDAAPGFNLVDQGGDKVKLADLKGGHVLLYFYPKAGTPGCTKQACNVRDAMADLQKANATAVGISPDPPERLARFDEKKGLGFRLLSDPDHKVADAYGAWGEKSMYGRKYEGIIRSAFLIDPKGKVAGTWYKVSPKDTVPKVMAALLGDD